MKEGNSPETSLKYDDYSQAGDSNLYQKLPLSTDFTFATSDNDRKKTGTQDITTQKPIIKGSIFPILHKTVNLLLVRF